MKKIVLKVCIICAKCKVCVMKCAAKVCGIIQISVDAEKGLLTVIGDADPCAIVKELKKVKKFIKIDSVGPYKKEDPPKPPDPKPPECCKPKPECCKPKPECCKPKPECCKPLECCKPPEPKPKPMPEPEPKPLPSCCKACQTIVIGPLIYDERPVGCIVL